MEVTKQDWKLFQKKVPEWQEAYMERLIREYIKYLQSDRPASVKFWEMEKRLKRDRKKPGVMMELEKSEVPWDLVRLLHDKVITLGDLEEFSDGMKEFVGVLFERTGNNTEV